MGERLSDEELSSVLKTALKPDVEGAGAVHRLHGEARRSRESEKRLVEALHGALHHLSRVKDKCEYDHYNAHEVNGALREPIQRAREALSAAGVKP